MARTEFDEAFTDPRRHGCNEDIAIEVSAESARMLVALAARWKAQDGHAWTPEIIARKVVEEFCMNHPEYKSIEKAGELPLASRELLQVLAKKYGVR